MNRPESIVEFLKSSLLTKKEKEEYIYELIQEYNSGAMNCYKYSKKTKSIYFDPIKQLALKQYCFIDIIIGYFDRDPTLSTVRFIDLLHWRNTKKGHSYWNKINKRILISDDWNSHKYTQ